MGVQAVGYCIICGAQTGDGCVPVCADHMGIAALAGDVAVGRLTDWPEHAPCYPHDYLMCSPVYAHCGSWLADVTAILVRMQRPD